VLDDEKSLISDIRNAENLHGHLGPFLVIGVKMARLAKKTLNLDETKQRDMQILAKLPLVTPFSCILDGIQAITKCTVGNRKLKVKRSNGDITAIFKIKSQDKAVKILVKPQLIDELKIQLSIGAPNEKLAWIVAGTSEDKLFEVQNR